MHSFPSFIRPSIFKREVQRQPLKVFICGPGLDTHEFRLRKRVQSYLSSFENCTTTFGEDITSRSIAVRRADLQTLESQLAQSVDFTVLLLQSPGAIAELGTFSMIPSIRSRLYVLLPSSHFGSKSYISRGPLSLIAKDFKRHVIYFDHEDDHGIPGTLNFVVAMYKYARSVGGHKYAKAALNDWRDPSYKSEAYEKYFKSIRSEFFQVVVLAGIILLDTPTFAEIVDETQMHPDEVGAALNELHSENRIFKTGKGKARYSAANGFRDDLLLVVDAIQLSRAKASHLAFS
jgi:hypothetical protein